MTVNQVMGAQALESEKELEELKKRNLDLENEISYMRYTITWKCAIHYNEGNWFTHKN